MLAGVSLELAAGEYVAIMGDSGVGKSTLLNLVAGLDHVDSGDIAIGGVSLAGMDDDALTMLRRRSLGFVFQAFHVLPYLTVAGNVALPLSLNGRHGPEADARVQAMLDAVGLGERGDSMPRELSGGEMQRVAIARALVHQPRLLLADEPTGNLDPDSATQVLALLRDAVRREGTTAILVTHSLEAARTADRILVLRKDGLHPADPSPAAGR